MTKKHFEAIAAVLKDAKDATNGQSYIAGRLADYFASQNPRFDKARFLRACGF